MLPGCWCQPHKAGAVALRAWLDCKLPCRFFYASSACIYPENRQLNTEVEGGGLKEEHAWPAQVRPAHPL